MSKELPKGWASAELNAIGTWRGGGTPSKAVPEYWSNGTVHWVSPKDMKRLLIDSAQDQITPKAVAESAANIIPKNSVLMVTRSGILEHTFPVSINTVEVAVNQDLKAWTLHRGINPIYAAYFLRARGQHILDVCSKDGTTVSSIDFDRLKFYPILLAPSTEQARVVSKIAELFSSIDEGARALERVRKLVERYRQSVLKAAVTGDLTREWREQHAGELESGGALLTRILEARDEMRDMRKVRTSPSGLAQSDMLKTFIGQGRKSAPLPVGWLWTSLGELKLFSLYGPRFASEDYTPDGYAVLRTSDIDASGRVNTKTAPKLSLSTSDFEKYAVCKGDLLITRTGSLGTLALYNDDVKAIPGAYLIQFRIPAPFTTLRYLFYFFKSPAGQAQLLAGGAGVGRPNLNAPTIEAIPIPLPPLREQEEILQRIDCSIDAVDRSNEQMAFNKKRQQALCQSILKSAFSGELVPQDPLDEPASALLERIAAERAATPKRTVSKQVRAKKTKSKSKL